MIVVLILGVLLNIAAPGFIHARDSGQAKACISNLHNINMAKEQWALQTNQASSAIPQWSNIQPYMHSVAAPVCPTTGQSYLLEPVNQMPVCPYGGPAGSPSLAHVF